MSFYQISSGFDVQHGLTFDQRSVLFILGHSLRHIYEPILQTDFDDRIRSSIERLATADLEER